MTSKLYLFGFSLHHLAVCTVSPSSVGNWRPQYRQEKSQAGRSSQTDCTCLLHSSSVVIIFPQYIQSCIGATMSS